MGTRIPFTDVVILFGVSPQLGDVLENFALRQVRRLFIPLTHDFALLSTNVTEVVLLPIMDIQLVLVIEKLIVTKEAMRVRLINMFLQGRVLIDDLLEHKYGFAFKAEFT